MITVFLNGLIEKTFFKLVTNLIKNNNCTFLQHHFFKKTTLTKRVKGICKFLRYKFVNKQ